MNEVTATEAQRIFCQLMDQTVESHQPILISGKRNKAVLIAEEDWEAIQETLFLMSIPGMRESIREGMNTPVEQCDKRLFPKGS
ncbi:MAG: type II toxin-antitoxin system Phd/YefM family antitoxin [Pseudomonadota bacterium]